MDVLPNRRLLGLIAVVAKSIAIGIHRNKGMVNGEW
jgi:hypothetical protein